MNFEPPPNAVARFHRADVRHSVLVPHVVVRWSFVLGGVTGAEVVAVRDRVSKHFVGSYSSFVSVERVGIVSLCRSVR